MAIYDVLQNANGDNLMPIERNETHGLFHLPDSDVYFISELEKTKDQFGCTQLKLKGGSSWESSGRYTKGEQTARELFDKLSSPDDSARYVYYSQRIV